MISTRLLTTPTPVLLLVAAGNPLDFDSVPVIQISKDIKMQGVSWKTENFLPQMLVSTFLALFAYISYNKSILVFSTANEDIIDTGYARYLGNRSFPNTVAYLGIPYAEPPLGEHRFRAPLPLNKTRVTQAAHGAVVDATGYPDFCVQGSIGGLSRLVCVDVPLECPYYSTQPGMPGVLAVKTV